MVMFMTEKTVTLKDFLTETETQKCVELYPDIDAIENQIIKPNIDRINRKLNQENNTRYLAYMVMYAIQESGQRSLN